MQEFFFQKRGIYYRKNEFNPENKTLVFIHGVSSSSSAWDLYEKKFETKYNILSLDLRGHGKSLKYENFDDYQIQNFASDIYELLKELHIEKSILISHSFGTLVALEFMVLHQDMLTKVIFLSPNYNMKGRFLSKILRPLLKITSLLSIFPFSPKPKNHIDYEVYKNTGDWNIRRLFTDIRNTGLRVYLYCIRQSYTFDREKFLKEIKIPTLIIHGKKDTISPVSSSICMAEKIKNSELHLLENANHVLVLNNFTEVSILIEEFIRK